MKGGVIFSLLACTSVGVAAKTPVERVGPQRPSVLFILVDDMQLGAVRRLAYNTPGSKVINGLIDKSAFFNRCYTMGSIGGALSMPSRAMLMTGRTLFETPSDGMSIPEKNVTIGERLRDNGYYTFATGKWHSDYASFNRTFAGGENIYFGGMHPYQNGGHTVPWLRHYDGNGEYEAQAPFAGDKFSSQMYADAAIEFLSDTVRTKNPFFCYVAFTSPHDPHNNIPWYSNELDSALNKLPPNYAPQHAFDNGELGVRDEIVVPAPRSAQTVKEQSALYGGMINEVGIQIGRILSALNERGLDKNTIIVFAADNGLAMGQHGLMGKQSLYDHSVNVPLSIYIPGCEGQVVDALCYLSDINPTLYELTGVEPPSSVTCHSLVGAIKSKKGKRDAIELTYSSIQRAVVVGDFKYIIYNVNGVITEQLFDLKNDAWEMSNLAFDKAYAKDKKRCNEKLQKLMVQRGDFCDISKAVWWSDGHKITWNEGVSFTPIIKN